MAKLLLVEDEKMLRDAYSITLSSQGFDLDVASDGVEALEYYNKFTYDLILLDLMMPDLDGLGFLHLINARQRKNGTIIIAFSNLSSGNEVEGALKLGADKHILKADLAPAQLIAFINNELQLKQVVSTSPQHIQNL